MKPNLLSAMGRELLIEKADLLRIIQTAPSRYKTYRIPKRHIGYRTIAQPSRELKILQYFVLEHVLARLPVHRSATGYVEGKNILANASAHKNSSCILKLDFKDFFPSIRVRDWKIYAEQNLKILTNDDVALLSNILFWGAGGSSPVSLSIGAPTSPLLSNVICFLLDKRLSEVARAERVRYTRYADDVTVSASSSARLSNFEAAARVVVRELKSPRLRLNEAKRGFYTSGQRRMVTGLIITPLKTVSMGRERKRLISVMIHKYTISGLSKGDTLKLKGLLGFAQSVEPDFVDSMRIKYGTNILDQIAKFSSP